MSKTFLVDQNSKGKRLDVFLQENLAGISRSHIKNLIENGKVFVSAKGQDLTSFGSGNMLMPKEKNVNPKAGMILKCGMSIEVLNEKPVEISTKGEDVAFEIVYEDKDIVVVNKPQGLVVHPCASTKSGTLVNGLIYRIKDLSGINGELRPGIVHRLDKDTSGLMVVAKNDFAHVNLAEQIKEKTAKRNYLALLEGNLKQDSGTVENFLKRDPKDRKKISVQPSGRKAITEFRVLQRFQKTCLVEFSLKTGRTHQIRVHAKYLGHPVVGDKLYGHEVKGLAGQLLHAYKLSFVHPRTGEQMTFEAPLPKYFEEYLQKQRVEQSF